MVRKLGTAPSRLGLAFAVLLIGLPGALAQPEWPQIEREVPEAVREMLPSLVRVVWERPDGSRYERAGYVDDRGRVGVRFPTVPRAAMAVIDSEGREHGVSGADAMTGMATAYGSTPRGLLSVEWEGAPPEGATVIKAKPDGGAVMFAVRPGVDGPWVAPLQLQRKEAGHFWVCIAGWVDLVNASNFEAAIVITDRGEVVGYPGGYQYEFFKLPMDPVSVVDMGMRGSSVFVATVERDPDLPIKPLTMDEYTAYVRKSELLDTEITRLRELAETDVAQAERLAWELTESHPDHPTAWATLAWIAGANRHEAIARDAAERAVACDPFDPKFVLRLCGLYGRDDPLNYRELRRLAPVLQGWSGTMGEANWYLFVSAWGERRKDRARAYLEAAMRLDPGNRHYTREHKRFFGAGSDGGGR